jgi:hypothetical protein
VPSLELCSGLSSRSTPLHREPIGRDPAGSRLA